MKNITLWSAAGTKLTSLKQSRSKQVLACFSFWRIHFKIIKQKTSLIKKKKHVVLVWEKHQLPADHHARWPLCKMWKLFSRSQISSLPPPPGEENGLHFKHLFSSAAKMIEGTEKPKIPLKFAKCAAWYNKFGYNRPIIAHAQILVHRWGPRTRILVLFLRQT